MARCASAAGRVVAGVTVTARGAPFEAAPRWTTRQGCGPPRVVVTGVGAATPAGVGGGPGGVLVPLLEGDPAPASFVAALRGDGLRAASGSGVAGLVRDDLLAAAEREHGGGDKPGVARFVRLALAAARLACADAAYAPAPLGAAARRTGVCLGAGMGDVGALGEAGHLVREGRPRRVPPTLVPRVLVNMAAGHVGADLGLLGPVHAAATACASGAHSLGDAFHLLRAGAADVVLAGGAEACVDPVALAGFGRARALSTAFNDRPASASRPFDARRDGFVIGEGAAVLVLETLEHARARGARVYAELRGFGAAADAFHVTQPPPDGRGAAAAMLAAIEAAGLEPSDVGYVNAHATSTPIGDAVECRALLGVFGDRFAAGGLPVSSTKGATGHLLGAAGAAEAAFTALALHAAIAPPTLNLDEPDVGLPEGAAPNLVARRPAALDGIRAALSNSFGFGGVNACVAFAAPP